MPIDWARAYKSTWHLYRVDIPTWADGGELGGFVSAEVERDTGGKAPEIDSGSLTVEGAAGWEFEPGYYRLVMVAEQAGAHERVEVATLLCESGKGTVSHGREERDIEGFSVLHPAATTELTAGAHVPAGADGAQEAARLLRSAIAAPVTVEGSFTLDEAYDFDFDAKVLDAAWALLNTGNYRIRIDGAGRVAIGPKPTVPALELSRANARLLMPEVGYELDWSGVPNRFTAIDGEARAQVANMTGSPASYDERGYWVDESDDAPKRINGETLQAFCGRKLEELSIVPDVREYEREYVPGVLPYDLVRGSMADVRLDGDMRVTSQHLELGNGITVDEEASREVYAWRR